MWIFVAQATDSPAQIRTNHEVLIQLLHFYHHHVEVSFDVAQAFAVSENFLSHMSSSDVTVDYLSHPTLPAAKHRAYVLGLVAKD